MIKVRGITLATRLSIAWVLVTVVVLLAAAVTGLLPARDDPLTAGRQRLGEALALQLAVSAQDVDGPTLAAVAHSLLETNPDLWSLAVRTVDGELVYQTVGHEALWSGARAEGDVPSHVELPAMRNGSPWGVVQLRFAPAGPPKGLGDTLRLPLFVGLLGFLIYRFVLPDVIAGRRVPITEGNVVAIEQRNARLERMVGELDAIRKQVQKQNDELQLLATQDTLTSCYNRRAIFQRLDVLWHTARRYGHTLSCIMLDIDHFKSVNDGHGHSTGDKVLAHVAKILRARTRKADLVGRYGGEEFCLLLPHTGVDQTETVAENLREAIESRPIAGMRVTASFGISSLEFGPRDPQELIDQADQAMYAAKHAGRNRTARWDRLDDVDRAAVLPPPPLSADTESLGSMIPYPAVLALISVLGQRDPDTAAHCRRVAELCDVVGHGLLSAADAFMLEVAALLHDIGKIGVPDAILLKPERLTEEERDVMRTHVRIGIEILNSAFHCDTLTSTVRHHHAHFGGTPGEPDLPTGADIPLAARILCIADAYDAMVSDCVYRESRTPEQAFEELRRCAGVQFDPELVERFVQTVPGHVSASRYGAADSTEVRLQLGLAVERLMAALQAKDLTTVRAMAERLGDVAMKCQRPDIAQHATRLAGVAASSKEPVDVLEASAGLVELCRPIQTDGVPRAA